MLFPVLVVLLLLCMATCTMNFAYADEFEVTSEFDSTDITSDLAQMSDLNGNAYNAEDYQKSADGTPRLYNFIEYAFSKYAQENDYFALYVYIYNPTGDAISTSSKYNTINVSTYYADDADENGYKPATNYGIFDLIYCSSTDDNLFYKFKVNDDKGIFLSRNLSNVSASRQYDVAALNLNYPGKGISDVNVGITFLFSGFSAGCGSETSTLACISKGLETISLDVHHTYYRITDAINEDGNNTQDTLNSVYFAVPNYYIENYGKLQKVHYEWEEYRTLPVYIFSDKDCYDILSNWVGRVLNQDIDASIIYTNSSESLECGYNVDVDFLRQQFSNAHEVLESIESTLSYNYFMAYLFYTGYLTSDGSVPWADEYTLDGNVLLDYMVEYSKTHNVINDLCNQELSDSTDYYNVNENGQIVINYNGVDVTLNCNLFTNDIDSDRISDGFNLGYNENEIDAGDTFDLFAYKENTNFWKMLFGKHTYDNLSSCNIKAIEAVTDKVSSSNLGSICDKYYISASDKDEFFDVCTTAAAEDSTVYVFHFAVTDYSARRLKVSCPSSSGAYDDLVYEDGAWTQIGFLRNKAAVASQQTVFLNFQIIDLTFNKNNVYTVIPVVSTPIDIISDVTPPVEDYTAGTAFKSWIDSLKDDASSIWDKIVAVLKMLGVIAIGVVAVAVVVAIIVLICKLAYQASVSKNLRRRERLYDKQNKSTKANAKGRINDDK